MCPDFEQKSAPPHSASSARLRLEPNPFSHLSISRLRRGYTPEATPVPIPNTAVKLRRADDTPSHRGGKVGRCDVNTQAPRITRGAFSFLRPERYPGCFSGAAMA